jgi:hypothetical protein
MGSKIFAYIRWGKRCAEPASVIEPDVVMRGSWHA